MTLAKIEAIVDKWWGFPDYITTRPPEHARLINTLHAAWEREIQELRDGWSASLKASGDRADAAEARVTVLEENLYGVDSVLAGNRVCDGGDVRDQTWRVRKIDELHSRIDTLIETCGAYDTRLREEMGRQAWRCGRCDWVRAGRQGEEIPKHSRHCPARVFRGSDCLLSSD